MIPLASTSSEKPSQASTSPEKPSQVCGCWHSFHSNPVSCIRGVDQGSGVERKEESELVSKILTSPPAP